MVRQRHVSLALRVASVLGVLVGATGCATAGGVPADQAVVAPSSTTPSAARSAAAVPHPEAPLGSGARPGAASSVPGTDPSIQRWFLRIDTAKIAFNNALFRAERGVADHVSSDCQSLDTTVPRIVAQLPELTNASVAGAKIAAAISPVMDTMAALAKDCLAGSWTAAMNDMNTGIPQQANSQALIDAILDGDR